MDLLIGLAPHLHSFSFDAATYLELRIQHVLPLLRELTVLDLAGGAFFSNSPHLLDDLIELQVVRLIDIAQEVATFVQHLRATTRPSLIHRLVVRSPRNSFGAELARLDTGQALKITLEGGHGAKRVGDEVEEFTGAAAAVAAQLADETFWKLGRAVKSTSSVE